MKKIILSSVLLMLLFGTITIPTYVYAAGANDIQLINKTITTLSFSTFRESPSNSAKQIYGFYPQPIKVDAQYIDANQNVWFRVGNYWFKADSYYDGTLPTVNDQYKANNSFFLYDDPSFNGQSRVIMNKSSFVNVKMTYNGWAMLNEGYSDKWIPLSTLTKVNVTPLQKTITTLSGSTFYHQPDESSGAIYSFFPQPISVDASTDDGWFRHGSYWFKPASYVDGAQTFTSDIYQANNAFYLYEDPSFNIQTTVIMNKSDFVNVKMTHNGWAMLDDGYSDKWIPLSTLTKLSITPKNITTLSMSTAYASPNTNTTPLYSFYPQIIQVDGATNDGWFRFNGKYWFKPLNFIDGSQTFKNDAYTANGTFYLYEDPSFAAQTKVLMKKDETVHAVLVYNNWAMLDVNKQYKWIPLSLLTSSVPTPSPTPVPTPPPMAPTTPVVGKVYNLELSRWNIYSDGTHPVETTKGLNDALQWAHSSGYDTLSVPAGTYLISKGTGVWNDTTSYITMPSDMALLLDNNTIIQKETNGFHGYKTLVIPMFAQNDTIKGGTFRGDKDTHDYYDGAVKWQANHSYAAGDKVISTATVADSSGFYYVATNAGVSGSKEPSFSNSVNTTDNAVIWKPVARDTDEGGYGIITDGAYNVTIDGVKSTNFTGDGLAIGGNRGYQTGGGQNSFESGSIDDNGNKIGDATKVRTKGFFPLTDPSFDKTHTFVVDMVTGFSQNYDAYFYKADGTYLSKAVDQKRGYFVSIPDGATKVALVFTGTMNSGINMEFQNKVQSTNIVVENSEFSFNRRQGITVGGGNNVLIYNNQIHDMKGTMPQSGIDVEGGFWEDGTLNTNINIENNNLYNNAKYDIVLYDGNTALVQGNHIHAFSDHGAVGLSIPSPFTNATVKDNDFYDTSIYAYHDVHFIGNTFQYSYTYLEGPNVSIDGMQFNSARFFMYPTKPYGITVNNISMTNGAVLGVWNNPVEINNMTASDFAWDYTDTNVPAGTIINNLKMTGNLYGGFGAATYNNCSFQVSGWGNQPLYISNDGTYTFNNCSFSGPKFTGFKVTAPNADVSINHSTIDIPLDSSAVLVEKAKSIDIENSTITSKATAGTQKSVVMIGDDWNNANISPVLKAVIKGNTITSSNNTNGITTIFSGQNASGYDIENNTLHTAKLNLKTNDVSINNKELTQ